MAKQIVVLLFWAGLAVVAVVVTNTGYPKAFILAGFALTLPALLLGLLYAANHYRKATTK